MRNHDISISEYAHIHYWLKNTFGVATRCENDGCENKSDNFAWAKKQDTDYQKKRENFIQLCYSCHGKMDCTEETRKKMRKINLGVRKSDETRAKMSQSKTGVLRSEETKNKIRQGHLKKTTDIINKYL